MASRDFTYRVVITAGTQEQADRVMADRLAYDDDYSHDIRSFDYTISVQPETQEREAGNE